MADPADRRGPPAVRAVRPNGYVKLDEAARQLGVARQTVLNQVRAGRRQAVMVVEGKRRGLRIEIHPHEQGLLRLADSPDA